MGKQRHREKEIWTGLYNTRPSRTQTAAMCLNNKSQPEITNLNTFSVSLEILLSFIIHVYCIHKENRKSRQELFISCASEQALPAKCFRIAIVGRSFG